MLSNLRSLFIAAAFAGVSTVAQAAGIIIPIYGNTTSQFNAAVTAAQRAPSISIINPDDGPGSSKVGGISGNVSRLKAAGSKVVGYINTYYGGESLSEVYKQLDRYRTWYGATGVYLDEMSDSTGKIGYYRSIYNYAKGKGMMVVGNPGTFVPAGYASVADVLVTFEDPASRWGGARQVSWSGSYPRSKFSAIIYSASASSMKSYIDAALARKYGWIFVTDRGGSDPFGSAPSFQASMASYLKTK